MIRYETDAVVTAFLDALSTPFFFLTLCQGNLPIHLDVENMMQWAQVMAESNLPPDAYAGQAEQRLAAVASAIVATSLLSVTSEASIDPEDFAGVRPNPLLNARVVSGQDARLPVGTCSSHYIKGVGNCPFEAIAVQVYGGGHEHSRVRTEVCDYIEQHPEQFAGRVRASRRDGFDSIDVYLLEHKRSVGIPGAFADPLWGDLQTLEAACLLYQRVVVLYTTSQGVLLRYEYRPSAGDYDALPIVIDFTGFHYELVIPSNVSIILVTSFVFPSPPILLSFLPMFSFVCRDYFASFFSLSLTPKNIQTN